MSCEPLSAFYHCQLTVVTVRHQDLGEGVFCWECLSLFLWCETIIRLIDNCHWLVMKSILSWGPSSKTSCRVPLLRRTSRGFPRGSLGLNMSRQLGHNRCQCCMQASWFWHCIWSSEKRCFWKRVWKGKFHIINELKSLHNFKIIMVWRKFHPTRSISLVNKGDEIQVMPLIHPLTFLNIASASNILANSCLKAYMVLKTVFL